MEDDDAETMETEEIAHCDGNKCDDGDDDDEENVKKEQDKYNKDAKLVSLLSFHINFYLLSP